MGATVITLIMPFMVILTKLTNFTLISPMRVIFCAKKLTGSLGPYLYNPE